MLWRWRFRGPPGVRSGCSVDMFPVSRLASSNCDFISSFAFWYVYIAQLKLRFTYFMPQGFFFMHALKWLVIKA